AYLDREHGADDYRIEFDSVARSEQGFRHLHIHVVPRFVGADARAGGSASAAGLTTGPDKPVARQLFRDLESALRVDIAVAFVFSAALQAGVLSRLRDVLVREGSRVRLLTGDYQGVTEPAALRSLVSLREQADAALELR